MTEDRYSVFLSRLEDISSRLRDIDSLIRGSNGNGILQRQIRTEGMVDKLLSDVHKIKEDHPSELMNLLYWLLDHEDELREVIRSEREKRQMEETARGRNQLEASEALNELIREANAKLNTIDDNTDALNKNTIKQRKEQLIGIFMGTIGIAVLIVLTKVTGLWDLLGLGELL